MPQLTLKSIRRCWKVNTEPPSSSITKGEAGTAGEARKCDGEARTCEEGDDMREKAARSGAGLRCGVPKVRGFRPREGDGASDGPCDDCGDKGGTAAMLSRCGEAGGTPGDVNFRLEIRRCGEEGGGAESCDLSFGEGGGSLFGSDKSEPRFAMLGTGKLGICEIAALYRAT